MTDINYCYPQEVIALLVQTIPRINKSKRNVIDFFRTCNVSEKYLDDLSSKLYADKESLSKFQIAETVLKRVNESDDTGLSARRQIIKQITEFESFETLWPNDQASARGYVSQVRDLVNKKDTFTRLKQLQDNEEQKRRKKEEDKRLKVIQEKHQQQQDLKQRLNTLYNEESSLLRGQKLELLLNDFFKYENILVKESFTITGKNGEGIIQQVDGAIEVKNHFYLVEIKWWNSALGPGDISQHVMRLYERDPSTRGIFISTNGYTPAAVNNLEKALKDRLIVLFSLKEVALLLERGELFSDLLEQKVIDARTSMKLSFEL